MLTAAKDALTSRAALAWANRLVGRYGRVESLQVNSRQKTIAFAVQLKGEPDAIAVQIEDYAVETDGDAAFLRARRFFASRPWLQSLLNDHGPRQRIRLPAWAVGAL